MGGWFAKEVTGLESCKGLRYRMPGLGGEVVRRLGAIIVNLPGAGGRNPPRRIGGSHSTGDRVL
jgi:TRAP-type mannitol/chloroaromatic compound transport system substrate-binding protein